MQLSANKSIKHDVGIEKWQSSISVLKLCPLITPNAKTICFKSNCSFVDVCYGDKNYKFCSKSLLVSDHSKQP